MEARVESSTLTCRACGRDVETSPARQGHSASVPIETGFMDFRGLPEPPRDSPTPWRV